MSYRALALRATMALFVTGLGVGLSQDAAADCIDTPITITFDAGSGTQHCYTESGVTVCAFRVFAPDYVILGDVTLGDNDGDSSPDLMNYHANSGDLVYVFSMGGALFAVTGFDFNDLSGEHYFQNSNGSSMYVSSSGHVTPDSMEWSYIRSFTWVANDGDSPGGVMDNLTLVAQCCGNGVVDSGEQCDDGNNDDYDCCSRTCQYETSGSFCTPDANFCTDDVCDGAGTCLHPAFPNCNASRPCGPPRPLGNPTFEHPKSAKTFWTSLVQAFVVCGDVGGNTPDRTTEGGIPACRTETLNHQAGSPSNGWHWNEGIGFGYVKAKPICGPAAEDMQIKLRLGGVLDGTGAPANATGTLAITLQATVSDPTGGTMTTIPLFGQISVTLTNGDGAVQTSVGVIMSESGMPDVPNGSSLEIVELEVRDPNGTPFARPGLFLP